MSKKHALLTYVGESKKLIPSLREKLSCYLSCSSEKSNFSLSSRFYLYLNSLIFLLLHFIILLLFLTQILLQKC